jgi:hypothetical protein
MIRFQCPECDKKLGVKEALAGQMGVCPACKSKFRIPEAPAPSEPVEDAVIVSPPPRRPEPELRKRLPAEDDDEDPPEDEEEEEERAPRRKRRRRRRKSSSNQFGGMPVFAIALIGLGVFAALTVVLALIVPAAAAVPVYLGSVISFVGGIWFLVVAFQDSPTAGFLCMCVPFYSLVYLISNFEETKKPFFVYLVGIALSVAGSCAGGRGERPSPKFQSAIPNRTALFVPNGRMA